MHRVVTEEESTLGSGNSDVYRMIVMTAQYVSLHENLNKCFAIDCAK